MYLGVREVIEVIVIKPVLTISGKRSERQKKSRIEIERVGRVQCVITLILRLDQ